MPRTQRLRRILLPNTQTFQNPLIKEYSEYSLNHIRDPIID